MNRECGVGGLLTAQGGSVRMALESNGGNAHACPSQSVPPEKEAPVEELRFSLWPRAPTPENLPTTTLSHFAEGEQMSSTDRKVTLTFLRGELRRLEAEVAELEVRLMEAKRSMGLVRATLQLLSPYEVDHDEGLEGSSFILTIGKTCLQYGNFNIPTSLAHLLAEDGHTILLHLENDVILKGTVRRYDNRNGQPRIRVGRPFRNYLQHSPHLTAGSRMKVDIVSPQDLRLSMQHQREEMEE